MSPKGECTASSSHYEETVAAADMKSAWIPGWITFLISRQNFRKSLKSFEPLLENS
jgi:hypothetical protein